jgi:DNA-binding XRE family transcriptional regulator
MSVEQTLTIKGERFVLLEEREYQALRTAAEHGLPPLPPADAHGHVSAVEYSRVSLARKMILARRQAGLTQGELAKLAGVRLETINRLEKGRHSASPATVARLEAVLKDHPPQAKSRRALRKTA